VRLRSSFESLWTQIERFFESGSAYATSRGYLPEGFGKRELVTNAEWLDSLGLVEFLGTVGRHVRVGQMLARESVKARMESAQGINYAEFTYQLLQSYDFWYLHKTKGCRLQVCTVHDLTLATVLICLPGRRKRPIWQHHCRH
jgi:tyrosyl-tRNA synthetase